MINDRQQTLQKVDIQIRSSSITFKEGYKNRSAEERRQLFLLVSHDKTWQKHNMSSSLHALGVCIDVTTCLVIDYELMLPTLLKYRIGKYHERTVDTMEGIYNTQHVMSTIEVLVRLWIKKQ